MWMKTCSERCSRNAKLRVLVRRCVVLYPTCFSNPRVGALLKRSTSSCASISGPARASDGHREPKASRHLDGFRDLQMLAAHLARRRSASNGGFAVTRCNLGALHRKPLNEEFPIALVVKSATTSREMLNSPSLTDKIRCASKVSTYEGLRVLNYQGY